MKFLLVAFFSLFISTKVFSQVYYGHNSRNFFYIEIHPEQARVEVYSFQYHFYYINKSDDKILLAKNINGDTVYSGDNLQVFKRKNEYFLMYPSYDHKKPYKIKLKLSGIKESNRIRNRAYFTKRKTEIRQLKDSVAKGIELNPSENNLFWDIDDELPDSIYKKEIDSIADSLIDEIINIHKPFVDRYRVAGDSIQNYDSKTIHNMLAQASYPYNESYSKDFIFKIALKKPEYLISYIDSDPDNKKEVLNAIRDDNRNKIIVKKVKAVKTESKGKKEIVKQRGRKIKENIMLVLVGIAITLIGIAEIALLVWLVSLLF